MSSAPTAGALRSNAAGTNDRYSMRSARRTNYFFATGTFNDDSGNYASTSSDIRRGMFGNNGAAKMATITDGTSNTIALGESLGGSQFKTDANWGPWALCGVNTCCHGAVPTSSSTTLSYTATNLMEGAINAVYNNDAQKRTFARTFSSKHPGGAQFALGDGSTRFISETIDYLTFAKLNYIADGQVVGEY